MKVGEDAPNRFAHEERATLLRETLYRSSKDLRRVTAIQTRRVFAPVSTP